MIICKCSGGSKAALVVSILFTGLTAVSSPSAAQGPGGGSGGGGPATEDYGNNLSFPVIWAEGVTKALRGTPETTDLRGEYWYQWGTTGVDPNISPASCPADPDEKNVDINPGGLNYCDDKIPFQVSQVAGVVPEASTSLPLAKAYLQKDPDNTWQAGSADWSNQGMVAVNGIDWGDSLESVNWYTSSQVRIEVVLFKNLTTPMTEYEMRHTSGWGIDEAHGLATTPVLPASGQEVLLGPGTQATVYSPCARLTMQKLLAPRATVADSLTWDANLHAWTGAGLINPAILNQAVYEAGDGPGYYNAEINVKGRIIYGYTWNVRQLNDLTGGTAAGDYRLTFSLDATCPTLSRNTTFAGAAILIPLEEELVAAAEVIETSSTDEGGATAQLDAANNLTYIDVRIIERTGGGGGRR